jgi:hypothetical protein
MVFDTEGMPDRSMHIWGPDSGWLFVGRHSG